MSSPLPAHVVREIAVKAKRDPKTVLRFLRGQPVRPIAAAAIHSAMRALELEVEFRDRAERSA